MLGFLLGLPSVGYGLTPQSPTTLPSTSGVVQPVGTVNVASLPEGVSGPASAVQITMPFLRPNQAGFAAAKLQSQQPGFTPTGNGGKIIVLPGDLVTGPQVVTVDKKVSGVGGTSPNPCGCSPPDVANAVGTSNVMEFVNLAGKVWNKAGTVLKNTFSLSSFFLLPSTDFLSDPYVIFDSISSRWFASILDVTRDKVVFAVSTTSDATGTFVIYSVTGPAPDLSFGVAFPDQPFIGADADKFGITGNQFSCSAVPLCASAAYDGTELWIVNKAQLVAGNAASFSFFTPDTTLFTLRPARHLGSTTDFFVVSNCKEEAAPFNCVSSANTQTHSLVVDVVTGVPGVSTVTLTSFLLSGSIATSSIPPGAVQPGTGFLLNTNDNRILSAVWQSSNLWLSWTDACIPGSGDTTTRSCGRLTALTTSGSSTTPTVAQDFDFAAAFKYVFYPAVSTDSNNNVAVVFGRSGSTEEPSILLTGRMGTAAPLTLQNSVRLFAGTAPDTIDGRWGDYFSASTDPSTSPTTTSSAIFWVGGEFRTSSSFVKWSTELGEMHLTP